MGGFVSSPPANVPGPGDEMVAHDGWYPGISLVELRDTMRIPTQVTDVRLTAAARAAMLTVSRELRAWKGTRSAEGVTKLQDVGDGNDAWSEPVLLYQRAVYSFAAADIAETHSDVSATGDGKDRAEAKILTAGEHRRNGIHAIRDILGVGRTSVELI